MAIDVGHACAARLCGAAAAKDKEELNERATWNGDSPQARSQATRRFAGSRAAINGRMRIPLGLNSAGFAVLWELHHKAAGEGENSHSGQHNLEGWVSLAI